MRYIIAAKLRKLKKGKFHCASGSLNSLLCTVAASSLIKFLATDWLFPDKYVNMVMPAAVTACISQSP